MHEALLYSAKISALGEITYTEFVAEIFCHNFLPRAVFLNLFGLNAYFVKRTS